MATPAFRAAGTAVFSANSVANPTALAPAAPAGRVSGDLLVCITGSRSITATITTPSGWTLATGFPKRSATASGGSIYVFVRTADGTNNDNCSLSWSGVATGTTGDSSGARILAYQNALTTQDGTPPAAGDAASTTSITIPAHTTASANSLVVGAAIRVNDTVHTFTVATFTERSDDHTTTGTGHGTVTADKVNTAAGSSGTATVTPSNTTSSRTLAISAGFRAATTVSPTAAAEADTAQALVFSKPIRKALSSAAMASAAQALTVTKPIRKTLTATSGTDSAQTLGVTKPLHATLTPATETDEGQPLGFTKRATLAPLTETDVARPVVVGHRALLTPAVELDTAAGLSFSVGGAQTVSLTQALETDVALAPGLVRRISATSETDTAVPLRRVLRITPATELDVAAALSVAGSGMVAESSDTTISAVSNDRRGVTAVVSDVRTARAQVSDRAGLAANVSDIAE